MHRNRRWVTSGIVLAALAALVVAQTTVATFPGRNGRITFMREDANAHWQVWVSDPDLRHARQLTDFDASSGWSAWSPDGSRLLFDSDLTDPDHDNDPFINDLFTIKPDGTDLRNLTDSVGYAGGAGAWSPDGKLIVFEADRGDYPAQAGIYVMNSQDGSNRRRLTTLPAGVDWDGAPKFSPDGKRIAFTRFTPDGSAVHTMRLDGTGLRRLTPWELNAGDADWSPDGKQLVFEADFVNGRGDAWIVGANGQGLRNLTFRPAVPGQWEGFSDPVFSPDGKVVMALHGIHYEDGSFTGGLATINVDGSSLEYVADGLGIEHQVDWARLTRP